MSKLSIDSPVSAPTASLNPEKANQFLNSLDSSMRRMGLIELKQSFLQVKPLPIWKQWWMDEIQKIPNPEYTLTALKIFLEIINTLETSEEIGSIGKPSKLNNPFDNKHRKSLVQFFDSGFFNEENFIRLIILFSNSPSLTRLFLKDPLGYQDDMWAPVQSVAEFKCELEDWLEHHTRLLNQKTTKTDIDKKDTLESSNWVREQILNYIRILKIKCYLRIALADYLNLDSFETTVEKISFFAEIAVRYALFHSKLEELPIAVVAMGKLGGNELNYNSDIDVMFVAANDLITHRNYKSTHDTISKIQEFIGLLSEFTSNGSVYEVDLRIRPEGDQGPLYLTLEQYYMYYQNRAESWEFQALIKARSVGGNTDVGRQFEEFRAKWVFNPDFSSKKMLLSISRIKQNIEKFHKPDEYRNVKLAPGGIRDLEFIVQYLQIHHGKITRVLSYTNTLQTLDKFLTYKIISPRQHKFFKSHYCFLRRIEHYLQLVELLPIHSLPTDEKPLQVISRMMGFASAQEFLKKTKEVMNFNQDLFLRIFKVTTSFYEKIDEIKVQLLRENSTLTNEHLIYFSEHITHLESDYFLNFSAKKIINHIKLLQKHVNQDSIVELEFSSSHNLADKNNNVSVQLEIVSNDYRGIFSIICGLLSLHGISILNGASFLYQKSSASGNVDKYSSNADMLKFDTIQEHEFNHIRPEELDQESSGLSKKLSSLSTKRIIFSMEGIFVNSEAEQQFSLTDFQNALSEAIVELKAKLSEKTMERILFRSITAFKKFGLEPNREELKIIQLDIDNTSHPLYTIIDIKSEDSFLFLFFFTYALSFKGYYIVKVEFSTPRQQVRNRIFLTDQQRGKIHHENKLIELKSSILLIKYFSAFMKDAPNPSLAYKTFNKLVNAMAVKEYSQDDQTDFYVLFKDLVKVLGTGEVIMEDFLRLQHNDIRTFLRDKKTISEPLTIPWLEKRLQNYFAEHPRQLSSKNLNAFKDQILFHLDLRLLTGAISTFGGFCEEMSNLTDVVMGKAIQIVMEQTLEKFALKQEPGRHALVALGKWGSREMGYSSDVELVFVYDSRAITSGYSKISHSDEPIQNLVKDFYTHMGILLPGIIESKKNGVFEVDLRLRPEGDSSAIATSLSKFKSYYAPGGRYHNYEKMVLTRLRVVNGDPKLAQEIEDIKNYFVYEMDSFDIIDFQILREKQIAHLTHTKNPSRHKVPEILHRVNVKFSPGGLVDIEYLVQILTIQFGKQYPVVRVNHILGAVEKLQKTKLIDKSTAEKMVSCYKFLRNLINCLRIMRGNAKDMELPERSSLEAEYLKRTMLNFKAIAENIDLYDKIRLVMEQVIHLQKIYLYQYSE